MNPFELHARDRKTGRLVSAISRSGQRRGLSNAEILAHLRAAPEDWWVTAAKAAQTPELVYRHSNGTYFKRFVPGTRMPIFGATLEEAHRWTNRIQAASDAGHFAFGGCELIDLSDKEPSK